MFTIFVIPFSLNILFQLYSINLHQNTFKKVNYKTMQYNSIYIYLISSFFILLHFMSLINKIFIFLYNQKGVLDIYRKKYIILHFLFSLNDYVNLIFLLCWRPNSTNYISTRFSVMQIDGHLHM